jgi:flavodoxin
MSGKPSGGSLLILSSYHHGNTEKVARVIAEVLGAQVKAPQDVNPGELQEHGLIGFGSGIYGAKHHDAILEFAQRLPPVTDKRAFIFSTSAIITKGKVTADHSALRDILTSKGYAIVDEFSCRGFNTNSFLKVFGGMNKGRPNTADLDHARSFARRLQQKAFDHKCADGDGTEGHRARGIEYERTKNREPSRREIE